VVLTKEKTKSLKKRNKNNTKTHPPNLPSNTIEFDECCARLTQKGLGALVKLMLEDNDVFTKKGRINKSKICRIMSVRPKELEKSLDTIRGEFGW